MKHYKYIILSILAVSVLPLKAQTIDPTLEVRRDFDARLIEITKGKLNTFYADSLRNFDIDFKYSFFDKPVKNLYDFTPLKAGMPGDQKADKQPFIYLMAGANYPLNPYGRLYIQPNLGKKFAIVLTGSNNSYLSELPISEINQYEMAATDKKVAAPRMTNNLGLDTKYRWEKGETGIKLIYDNSSHSYYGFDNNYVDQLEQPVFEFTEINDASFMRKRLSQNTAIIGASLYSRSVKNNNRDFFHDINVSYSLLRNKSSELTNPFSGINWASSYYPINSNDLTYSGPIKKEEKYLNLKLNAGVRFAGFNKMVTGVHYQASNALYTDSLNRSNLELHPKYIFTKGKWEFDFGFKYNMWWEGEEEGYNIYLSASAIFELIDQKMWLYGLFDGKNNFMNYHKLSAINPWYSANTEIKNTEQPVIARAGIKGNILERLSYNIYGEYIEFKNRQYFYYINGENFTIQTINSFGAVYADEKRTGAGAELKYTGKSFSGGMTAAVYSFRDNNNMTDNHYNYSPFELQVYGEYNWRKRLFFTTDITHIQKKPVLTSLMLNTPEITPVTYIPSYTCINVGLSYVHNKNIEFFLKLNNILNSEIYDYAFYSMPGINGGLGIALSF